MIVRHASRSGVFRSPFGAAGCGSPVRLRLRIDKQGAEIRSVTLHYAYGITSFTKGFAPMPRLAPRGTGADETDWYGCRLVMPMERALLFYYMEIRSSHGVHFLVPEGEDLDHPARLLRERPVIKPGEGTVPALWQISVHQMQTGPSYLPGAVMYQIFPDRYKRGKDFNWARLEQRAREEGALIHRDWGAEVDFEGSEARGYEANDFFGGTLQGIMEELDYLAGIGVDVLYLNPINQARSNHRYDAGDYLQVDPLLGEVKDFEALCVAAKKRGMRVILDGVFSHTGADSRYFNKYGRYPSVGAWQAVTEGKDSPYSSWYHFFEKDGQVHYDAWWGFPELPNVHEENLSFLDYICGEEGVIATWLSRGASGWRLDVSDELPDAFIRAIHARARACDPEAMILGEIWEDASHKISYGAYRDFLLGQSHDVAMGYPFRAAVLDWLRGATCARIMAGGLERIREHYPLRAYYGNMNLISSHDTPRAITVLAGAEDPGSRSKQVHYRLDAKARQKGEALLRLGSFLQLTWPGMASLYYGDELGMEGYRDPFNRRTYHKEARESAHCRQMEELFGLRRVLPVLKTGTVRVIEAQGDLFVFSRGLLGPERKDVFGEPLARGPRKLVMLVNRSEERRCFKRLGLNVWLDGYEAQIFCPGQKTPLYSLREGLDKSLIEGL